MSSRIFTKPEAWAGFSYELAVELGPVDDARLERALRIIWSHADLDGCYLERDREPAEQVAVRPAGDLPLEAILRGLASLGPRAPVACSTIPVREEGGSDWVYFSLPMGSLRTVFPVYGFPVDDGSDLSWRSTVDHWLCRLARHLFDTVKFRLGLVGCIDGLEIGADELLVEGVPDERWVGYLVPSGDALTWYPPTEGAPHRPG